MSTECHQSFADLAAELEAAGKPTYGDAPPAQIANVGYTVIPTPLLVKVINSLKEAAERR